MTQARAYSKIVGEVLTARGGQDFILRSSHGRFLASPSPLIISSDISLEIVDGALIFTAPGAKIAYADGKLIRVKAELQSEASDNE